jgi:hypothetical protein
MSDTTETVNTDMARTQALAMKQRLDARKMPTRNGTRELVTAVLSLSNQLDDACHGLEEAQAQLVQLNILVKEWNQLFSILQRLGLTMWEELRGGIAYQWRGGPVVKGFSSWAEAVEAALHDRQL